MQQRVKRIALAGFAALLVTLGLASAPANGASQETFASVDAAVAAALAAQPDMPPVLDDAGKVIKPAEPGHVRGLVDRKTTPNQSVVNNVDAKGKSFGKLQLNPYAPKGMPKVGKPTGAKQALVNGKLTTVYYHYGQGWQYVTAAGASVNIRVDKPFVNDIATGGEDYHSLGEVAVGTTDGLQHVEIGWIVSKTVNGDSNAHLFVFNWINGNPGCYNACGFTLVTNDPTKYPGATLTTGTGPKFKIQQFDNVWWVGLDTTWIGYYDNNLWTGATPSVSFTQSTLGQPFLEVASTVNTPCGDMGNGDQGDGSSTTATYLNSWSNINPVPAGTASSLSVDVQPAADAPDKYKAQLQTSPASVRTFRSGGKGWNSAGTAAGTKGAC